MRSVRWYGVLICLPLAAAYPSYVDCGSDENTTLKMGTQIMGIAITPASGVSMVASRNGVTTTNHIPGELLEVQISGIDSGALAVIRSNDAANATLSSNDGMFQSQCAGQMYSPQTKGISGKATFFVRPGCNSGTVPLNLVFVSATKYGSPVPSSQLILAPSNKQDPSCHGGAIPTPIPPPQPSTLYNRLVVIHRTGVVFSWGFFFPLGVALVRFYPSGSRMKLHRIVQSLGCLIEVIQFTCIVWAHEIGVNGEGPADGNFAGTQGSAPTVTHKQRGFAVFLCVLMQLVLGIFRPAPFPNNLKRRFWLHAHRLIGDGAIVVAWINIYESTAVMAEGDSFYALTISALLFMCSTMIVVPAYYMLLASRGEAQGVPNSVPGSFIGGDRGSAHGESIHVDPKTAVFFGCGYCSQVFTEKQILEVHLKFVHPGAEYREVLTPMPQRYAEVSNTPAIAAGIPLSEVRRHNTSSDCWVVINDMVYDLTNFLSCHPGGPSTILSWAGRDASRTWNLIHDPSWINQYSSTIECLGCLGPEPPVEGMPVNPDVRNRPNAGPGKPLLEGRELTSVA
eukprot:gnl/MRDRNA2_/MRDRNA2_70008_c0_seq1.p1 gnl/MRDRNA2_/MRDRNA2_70008_c0~~gnl/MRDRNA2_/MRDRNA2_70008_c0_seq1.p1  ORF type:complete len:566 (+),score=52.77 gnl/MRDRNA2_/MRDRNA2_70008_c0_seq1:62-1759(+)